MKILRWSVVPAAAAVVALAAGCGSGSGSAATAGSSGTSGNPAPAAPPGNPGGVAKQVSDATGKATSVHISADVTQSGKHVVMNASMTRSGGLDGRFTVNGVPITMLITHGNAYIKVTSAFMKMAHLPSAACSLICGKYLKTSAGDARNLTSNTGWSSIVASQSKHEPKLTYAGPATVNGQAAWKMRAPGNTTAFVAAHGTRYPLRVIKGGNQIDFSHWNKATISPPPPAKQVVDASKLGG
jgi:hypothetical protein